MASKPISQLTTITSLNISDSFVLNHSGTTSTATLDTLTKAVSSATNFIPRPAATNGQVLTYNGSTWVASAAAPLGACSDALYTDPMGSYVVFDQVSPSGRILRNYIGEFARLVGSNDYTMDLPVAMNLVTCTATMGVTISLVTSISFIQNVTNGLCTSITWNRSYDNGFYYNIAGFIS